MSGGGRSEEPKIHEFHVDRPFIYRIVHKSTNVTLFSGRVSRPKCSNVTLSGPVVRV